MMQSSSAVPPPVAKSDIAYAGFWRRLLAYMIDGTLLAGLDLALYSTVHVLAPDTLDAVASVVRVAIAIGWAYFAVLESSPARGTLGKIALGLYVADVQGDPISFGRAVFRNAMKSVSWLVFGIGWVLAAFTPRKQALHDLLAGTPRLRGGHHFLVGPRAPTAPAGHPGGSHWVGPLPPL